MELFVPFIVGVMKINGINFFKYSIKFSFDSFINIGTTKKNSGSSSYHKSIVPIVGHDYCNKQYKSNHVITERMICAGKNTAVKKTCRDDYGAPLTWRDPQSGKLKLIGLASFSKGCGDPNYPTVFANVESVRPWITKNTEI